MSGDIMMTWPYHFVNLDGDQRHLRRNLLDRYGTYAQLSVFVPLLVYQIYRLGVWATSGRGYPQKYSSVPSSPSLKNSRLSAGVLGSQWGNIMWWLGDEICVGWGLKVHWIVGASWAAWLMFLSVHKTGDADIWLFQRGLLFAISLTKNCAATVLLRIVIITPHYLAHWIIPLNLFHYLHVTKRFGIVAASQFPMHYLLSMKSRYSPIAFAFRSSHERLNPYHRISGRIIYSLLILHGGFYMNFFFQAGLLRVRLTSLVPLLGLLCLSLLTILASSSLSRVRRWSYRVFFILHLTIAVSILPVLFFHASPLRLYTLESLAILLFDIFARRLDTVTALTTVTAVSQTELIKLSVPIPSSKIYRFKVSPGQHVYLSIPYQSWPNKSSFFSIHNLLYNPFTVADVTTSEVTLVLRTLHGPTTSALRKLTKLSKAKPPINIEGPYGVSRHFPNFAREFDRVLLVAGGVGATFILPIYHKIQESFEQDGVRGDNCAELIWVMKSAAEAMWAMKGENLNSLDDDEHVRVYITSSDPGRPASPPGDGSIEMEDLRTVEQPIRVNGGYQRPNLRKIVDEMFRHGVEDRVAVIVCGPVGMAEELREHVGRWVHLGRHVWWHDESFGW